MYSTICIVRIVVYFVDLCVSALKREIKKKTNINWVFSVIHASVHGLKFYLIFFDKPINSFSERICLSLEKYSILFNPFYWLDS